MWKMFSLYLKHQYFRQIPWKYVYYYIFSLKGELSYSKPFPHRRWLVYEKECFTPLVSSNLWVWDHVGALDHSLKLQIIQAWCPLGDIWCRLKSICIYVYIYICIYIYMYIHIYVYMYICISHNASSKFLILYENST